jgi:hypothetical protein
VEKRIEAFSAGVEVLLSVTGASVPEADVGAVVEAPLLDLLLQAVKNIVKHIMDTSKMENRFFVMLNPPKSIF